WSSTPSRSCSSADRDRRGGAGGARRWLCVSARSAAWRCRDWSDPPTVWPTPPARGRLSTVGAVVHVVIHRLRRLWSTVCGLCVIARAGPLTERARLDAVAADAHGAPGARPVAGLVVERPQTVVGGADLHPLP